MTEKINLEIILKDCPTGMELNCLIFDNATLKKVNVGNDFPIIISYQYNNKYKDVSLTKYGCLNHAPVAKCIIFPKGQTTWKGFNIPFKEGDIVATESGRCLGIVKSSVRTYMFEVYCAIIDNKFTTSGSCLFSRLATDEEIERLFNAIKNNGYKWDAETKTLEKVVEPKFKVGDKIIRKHRKGKDYAEKVLKVEDNRYILCAMSMPIECQDEWELFIDKFDINTLVPFQSKVLVKDYISDKWKPAVYGYSDINGNHCIVGGRVWKYLIPYENNEHLMGITDDCEDYYKTWEE